jgi:lantibiotic biosynthesis protein
VSGEGGFLAGAERIGRRLCRDAVWDGDRPGWLGWAMEPRGGQWVTAMRAAGTSLYDGVAGIGLFLARLAKRSGDEIVAATAEAALWRALEDVDKLVDEREYGFYSGLTGVAVAAIEGGAALSRSDLAARGREALKASAGLAPRADRIDIVNGSAGALAAFLAYSARKGDGFERAAIQHGEALLKAATSNDDALSWDTVGRSGEPHLLGLGHGASGVAYALGCLGAATGRTEFLTSARKAMAYERRFFRSAEGNWPDLRAMSKPPGGGEPPCMIAWCHGAVGIGFARSALLSRLGEHDEIEREADAAVATTAMSLSSGRGMGNYSLCHGDGGNADFLLFAAQALRRPALRRQAEAALARGLERYEKDDLPWPCGVPGAGETPSLMLGLAGIGYVLLRLDDPVATPTVLLPGAFAVSPSTPPRRTGS